MQQITKLNHHKNKITTFNILQLTDKNWTKQQQITKLKYKNSKPRRKKGMLKLTLI